MTIDAKLLLIVIAEFQNFSPRLKTIVGLLIYAYVQTSYQIYPSDSICELYKLASEECSIISLESNSSCNIVLVLIDFI